MPGQELTSSCPGFFAFAVAVLDSRLSMVQMKRWIPFLFLSVFCLSASAQILRTLFDTADARNVVHITDATVDRNGNVYASGSQSLVSQFWKTADRGLTWSVMGRPDTVNGLLYELFADPEDPLTFYASTERGLHRSADGGKTWIRIRNGRHYSLVIDAGNRNVLLTTDENQNLFRSGDRGVTWMSVPPPVRGVYLAQDGSGFGSFALLAGATSFWLSVDHGATWQQKSLPEGVGSVAFHPHRFGSLYAAAGTGLYRTDDLVTWFLVSPPASGYITSIYADPQVPGRVWAAAIDGLFRSNDEGRVWEKVRGGEHRFIAGCGTLFSRDRDGAIQSTNGGRDWTKSSFSLSKITFGAACSGLGIADAEQSRFLRKYSPPGKVVWQQSVTSLPGIQRVVMTPQQELAVIRYASIDRYDTDGKLLSSTAGSGAVNGESIEAGVDGGVVYSGSEITLGGLRILTKFDSAARKLYEVQGRLLTLDSLGRAIARTDRDGVVVVEDDGRTGARLLVDPTVLALKFFTNGDFAAAGWNGAKYWFARYSPDSADPIWRTELAGMAPGVPVLRLTIDAGEQVYVEIPYWVETKNPFVPQLTGSATFVHFDRDGALKWSTALQDRRFLQFAPGGELLLVGGAGRVDGLTPPLRFPAQGIDVVLLASPTSQLGFARSGAVLVIKGRNLGPAEVVLAADPEALELAGVRVTVDQVAAKILSVGPSEVTIVVPAKAFGQTATIAMDSPNGKIEPVEIPVAR